MISISSIKTYMYCPLKLYLDENFNEKMENEILLHKTMKELRVDLNDLFHRNFRRLKKDMKLEEIEKNLSKNIAEYVENSLEIIDSTMNESENKNENIEFLDNNEKKIKENKKTKQSEEKEKNELYEENKLENESLDELGKLEKLKIELESEIYFNTKILALKAKKSMLINEKDGNQITELFFPTSMYSYLMRDPQLGIVGTCDKIEIVDGKYYPISVKSSNPPLKGTWDGDSIELVATAMLIEKEFDTEVFVGFVDYLKIAERRPVVMDTNLRKGLFKTLDEIEDILTEKIIPEVNTSIEKCINCEYNSICNQSIMSKDIT